MQREGGQTPPSQMVQMAARKTTSNDESRLLGLVAGGQKFQEPNDVGIVKKEPVQGAQKDRKRGRSPAPDLDQQKASQD